MLKSKSLPAPGFMLEDSADVVSSSLAVEDPLRARSLENLSAKYVSEVLLILFHTAEIRQDWKTCIGFMGLVGQVTAKASAVMPSG